MRDDLVVIVDRYAVARRRNDAEPIDSGAEHAVRATTVIGKGQNDALAVAGAAGARENLAVAEHESRAVHHRLVALAHHRSDIRREALLDRLAADADAEHRVDLLASEAADEGVPGKII